MELEAVIAEIEQTTKRLEGAAAGDFALLANLLARRSELIQRLRALAASPEAGRLAPGRLEALRSSLACGALLAGRLQMKRLELALEMEAARRQKTLTCSFARPGAGTAAGLVNCQG
jgi:hypothetical protein